LPTPWRGSRYHRAKPDPRPPAKESPLEARCRKLGLPRPVAGYRLGGGVTATVCFPEGEAVVFATDDINEARKAVNAAVLGDWRPVLVSAASWQDGSALLAARRVL